MQGAWRCREFRIHQGRCRAHAHSSSSSSTSWPLCTQGGVQPWTGPTAADGTGVGPEAAPGLRAAQRCSTSPRGLKTSVPPSSLPSQAALPSSPWFPVVQKDGILHSAPSLPPQPHPSRGCLVTLSSAGSGGHGGGERGPWQQTGLGRS